MISEPAGQAAILIRIARALIETAQGDVVRASQLLTAAEILAARLNEREKAAVLTGVAAVYSRSDVGHASRLLTEVVATTNQLDGFTGELKINRSFELGGFSNFYSVGDGDWNIYSVIARQARRDFGNTISDLRGIKSRLFRLRATTALCRGVLVAQPTGADAGSDLWEPDPNSTDSGRPD